MGAERQDVGFPGVPEGCSTLNAGMPPEMAAQLLK